MKINVFSALPEFFDVTNLSILGRSLKASLWSLNIIDLKQYGIGEYKKIDDTPYGGGGGMILRSDVIGNAIEQNIKPKSRVLLTSPRGKKFDQKMATELAKQPNFSIICNRFEGVDQRAIDYYNLEEVSIGDYIVFGGEVVSIVIIESVVRLLPDVIPNHNNEDSFCGELENMLEYDYYTKPAIWQNLAVPSILSGGNHAEIKKWRFMNAEFNTKNKKIK